MAWYVQVDNQAYGPYTDQQMHGFVSEGRLTESSLITADPKSGYFHANAYEFFGYWSNTPYEDQAAQQAQTPIKIQGEEPSRQEPSRMAVGAAYGIGAFDTHLQPSQRAQSVLNLEPSTPRQSVPVQARQVQNTKFKNDHPAQQAQAQQTQTEQTTTNVYLIMAEIRSEGAMGFLRALQNFGVAQRIGDTVWLVRTSSGVEQMRNTLSQTLNRQDRLFILDSQEGKTAWFNIGADLDNRIRELWSLDDE